MPPKTVIAKRENLRTSPKDVFLHLLMMVMLYLCVISLIALAFAYINYTFPDPLDYYRTGILDAIRIQSAMLIVCFPLLLLLSYFIQKDYRKSPAKHELRFSKWLIYLTLFVAALTIVIDLIQLINRFYGGDLTTPFVLKVFSVLVVAGAVFGYYIWDVQSEPHKSKIPSRVAWASGVVVVIMLVLGFFIVGSPATQRQIRMDDRRITDLQSIQSEIISYWQMKRILPKSIEQLRNDLKGFQPPLDPETNTPYEYKVLGDLQFSLCAAFDQKSFLENVAYAGRTVPATVPYAYPGQLMDEWGHEAGKKCFDRTIDPQLYPKPNP